MTTPQTIDSKTKRISYMNQAGRSIYGIGEHAGIHALQIADVHPEWANHLLEQKILPAAVQEGIWQGKCAFADRYSLEIPVLIALMAYISGTEDVDFFSTISRNITARKQAEGALRRAYDKLEQRIADRTEELMRAIEGLRVEILDRKRTEEALKESEKRYRELSILDDLTQLYNSRHFYFHLKNELDRSNRYEQPLTLLLLDLDNFKRFNDTYGHVEGDQVLMRLGQVVKRCLRETDFAYRYGGEEFTVLLPMTTSSEGFVTAERIRTEFRKETFSPVPGLDVRVTVSIGLAQYKPLEDMKVFVHRVDQLMYQGKKNGKDKVCSE